MSEQDFFKKQRHELALTWAAAVFNQNVKNQSPLSTASVEQKIQSINELYDLYIFAYREFSYWENSCFDSVPPDSSDK